MIKRVLSNLLDNAVKYTPPGGGVTVRVIAALTEALVVVEDSGPGIAPAEQERIFDRFYRGDASRSQSGSGLGLSLARALARAHGGDVTVTSEPGRGSVFTLWLPVL